ncbi:hypothetical protein PoB_001650600 [Plakobranchus ocellatus]|uniref:Uncharacterized protein n=1 Tax=Plakobranchus ocellatus TaxID=259542 RepID=A0AAV3Z2D7_9GAST|nr:hypothetical protein PoB_001650600 [Plakobranchus ocellatus]
MFSSSFNVSSEFPLSLDKSQCLKSCPKAFRLVIDFSQVASLTAAEVDVEDSGCGQWGYGALPELGGWDSQEAVNNLKFVDELFKK